MSGKLSNRWHRILSYLPADLPQLLWYWPGWLDGLAVTLMDEHHLQAGAAAAAIVHGFRRQGLPGQQVEEFMGEIEMFPSGGFGSVDDDLYRPRVSRSGEYRC